MWLIDANRLYDAAEEKYMEDRSKTENVITRVMLSQARQKIQELIAYAPSVDAEPEVFDTCFWIGRFWEFATLYGVSHPPQKIFRREEKLYLCGRASAKDANIRQALVDRYAPGQPNYGKGTKKNPGFFYGFAADMWAAMAVAVTYFDKYIRGIQL